MPKGVFLRTLNHTDNQSKSLRKFYGEIRERKIREQKKIKKSNLNRRCTLKTHQVAESLRYYTGILVREYDVLRWADKGLLGEISRFRVTTQTSKQRDFTDKNFERALLIVFLTKILHMPWNTEQLMKYLDNNDKLMSNEICMNLEKLETKGIPRFKHILLERENK